MQTYTKADIEKLALRDPIVHAHMHAQRYVPGITFEQMLIAIVVSLVEAKDAMTALAADLQSRMPPTISTVKPNTD